MSRYGLIWKVGISLWEAYLWSSFCIGRMMGLSVMGIIHEEEEGGGGGLWGEGAYMWRYTVFYYQNY